LASQWDMEARRVSLLPKHLLKKKGGKVRAKQNKLLRGAHWGKKREQNSDRRVRDENGKKKIKKGAAGKATSPVRDREMGNNRTNSNAKEKNGRPVLRKRVKERETLEGGKRGNDEKKTLNRGEVKKRRDRETGKRAKTKESAR